MIIMLMAITIIFLSIKEQCVWTKRTSSTYVLTSVQSISDILGWSAELIILSAFNPSNKKEHPSPIQEDPRSSSSSPTGDGTGTRLEFESILFSVLFNGTFKDIKRSVSTSWRRTTHNNTMISSSMESALL